MILFSNDNCIKIGVMLANHIVFWTNCLCTIGVCYKKVGSDFKVQIGIVYLGISAPL